VSDWIGRTLSKVEIQKLLGRGGMAEVYLGRHTTLNRPVAVKILHSHLSEDSLLLNRFRAEAQAVAALRHPNIVQVLDFDVADDRPYIIMELLAGASLADYLRTLERGKQKLPPETTARLIASLAAALDYAHARGIVHRDIKPANVMLRREAGPLDLTGPLPEEVEPVLTDFGVMRMVDSTTRTASGVISGTPAYMSPEQARGEAVDARSDIYSLGVMLYEMLAGRPPFNSETETPASLLIKHITAPPPPLPEASPAIQAIMDYALAKDREARYQKAGKLAADLLNALGLAATAPLTVKRLADQPTQKLTVPRESTPRRAINFPLGVIAGLGVILVLGLGAFWGWRQFTGAGAEEKEFGTLSFQDGSSPVDEVTLSALNLPQPKTGTQYQVWLISTSGEERHPLGMLNLDEKGNGQLDYVDDQGHNLLAEADRFEITLEPNPDSSPNPSNEVVFSGALPPQTLVHIRHLLVAFDGAPNQTALVLGLLNQAKLLNLTTQAMLAAQQAGKLAETRQNAEALVNIIEGQNGQDFGDVDGDGTVTDPSDGFGLLLNGESIGYIQGTLEHAKLGALTPDATAHIQLHAEHVVICAQNLDEWAVELRDLSLEIAQSESVEAMEGNARQAAALADRLLHGQDLNGNEIIDPLPQEGGAQTAYQHTLYMADISILQGPNRTPRPAPPGTSPSNEAGEYGP